MNALRRSLLLPLLAVPLVSQDGYRTPPKAIADVIAAPRTPSVSVSPDRTRLLLSTSESMPSIEMQARPILHLAGMRIDPASHSRQRGARTYRFQLMDIESGETRDVRVPENGDLGFPRWTADGTRFAYGNTTDDGVELWVADAETGESTRLDGVQINGVVGGFQWMPDQKTLLCQLVVEGDAPAAPRAPAGPAVQESRGTKAPVRTYQDLLTDEHDAALFEHFATSQLAMVDPDSGEIRKIGAPGIYSSVSAAPNGTALLVTRIERPFSYLVTYRSFPQTVSVWTTKGEPMRQIAKLPLAENVPIGGVLEGPRRVQWIPGEACTLMWAEALDGGDPKNEVAHRDRLVRHDPRTRAMPKPWFDLEHRYMSTSFGSEGELAVVTEYDRDTRWVRSWRAHATDASVTPTMMMERSTQDAYGHPGSPVTRVDAHGKGVMIRNGNTLLMSGTGASPEGDRPFLDIRDIDTGETLRRFHCAEGRYESVSAVLADDASRLLIRRETVTDVPNYFIRDTTTGEERALTHFTDPCAEVTKHIHKELIHYERQDGIPLSGTLYLPPGYEAGKDEPLPLLVWAYPREFNDRKNAGQVRGSPHRYTRLAGTSPLLLTLAGYAVLDNAAMPIVGPVETANDTFVEQLVAGAQAAIDVCVERGVAHRDRCAIAGHSYGAFMTANLLAHSDLFRAGVARSGAYNRTLTPFGFQNERRTFWEAPEIYFAMSPFMHAPKIDEPLLMIHGEVDNNSGTFPIQSQRLFHAVKGNGGIARLVMLPHESHGYRARESVMHCVAETVDWLDRFVKNAETRSEGGAK